MPLDFTFSNPTAAQLAALALDSPPPPSAHPQSVLAGAGVAEPYLRTSLPASDGPARVFILTTTSIRTRTPLLAAVEAALGPAHAGTFSAIRAHAPESDILAALDALAAADTDTNPDQHPAPLTTILSLGGGSPIDAAKVLVHLCRVAGSPAAAAALASSFPPDCDGPAPAPPRRSVAAILMGAAKAAAAATASSSSSATTQQSPPLTHISIPTTLAAAECSGRAGFTVPATGVKTGLGGPALKPAVVLYDPSFLWPHTPPHLLLSTAVRALDHAVELWYHPALFGAAARGRVGPDADAARAARAHACKAAVELVARLAELQIWVSSNAATTTTTTTTTTPPAPLLTALQLAAHESLAFVPDPLAGVPLGLSHTVGYALGSRFGIPHGTTSCISLPAVIAGLARMSTGHVLGPALAPVDHARECAVLHRLIAARLGRVRDGAGAAAAAGIPTLCRHLDGEHGPYPDVPLAALVHALVADLGLSSDLTQWKVGRDREDEIVARAAASAAATVGIKDGAPPEVVLLVERSIRTIVRGLW